MIKVSEREKFVMTKLFESLIRKDEDEEEVD
jgi:hypothetical protein